MISRDSKLESDCGDNGPVFRYLSDRILAAYGRYCEGGFTFHDLRHMFATNARKAGVEKNVIMVIMGHSAGNDMNFRYDSVDEADLLKAVDQIEVFLESVDHSVDHGQKNGSQEESQNRATY